jgi:hypothetical protein
MTDQNRPRTNPYSEQGVSKYPPVAPLVGQLQVFQRIQDMLEAMREETGSCFRAIFGDWGIGKTRLAHELVAEVCQKSKGWVIRDPLGKVIKTCLLESLSKSGILPVFTTFTDILKNPEEGITLRSALPKSVCATLVGLAEASGKDYQVQMANHLQECIRRINPNFDFDELSYIARQSNLSLEQRANSAFEYLQQNTLQNGLPVVKKLLVIIDEIETASEFTPANTADERRVQEYPIEALDIKNLFSAVKEEAGQTTLPHISFLLMCSPGVRRISFIEANQRRLKEATLEKATGDDLDQFLEELAAEGYLSDYPGDLPRAAFLAADRNFGWFSYIMHPVYRLMLDTKATGEDYEILQQISSRIGKVFKPQMIDGLSIHDDLKKHLSKIVYHQIPTSLEHLAIPEITQMQIIEYTDPFGIKVVGQIHTIHITADVLIRELLTNGYREESAASTKLIGEASVPFDPRDLLAKFSTFEGIQPDTYLVYASPIEFASQVRFVTSDDLTDRTIDTLHSVFGKYRLKTTENMLAPTVTFLLKFNERWASVGARPWLSEQQWEKLEKQTKDLSITQIRQQICLSIGKILYDTLPKTHTVQRLTLPYTCLSLNDVDNLSVTKQNALIILYGIDASSVIHDLNEIQKNFPAPVLLVFSNDDKLRDWQQELINTRQQHLATLVIPRVVDIAGREHEFLLRYSFRDEEKGFPASEVRDRGREQRYEYQRDWTQEINEWFNRLDQEGYLLRPITDQVARYNLLKKAYPDLAAGMNKDQITTGEGGGALRQAIDTILMQMSAGNTLKIFTDNTGTLYFPNVFSRILDLLTTPRRANELSERLIYRRSAAAGFNAPKSAEVVIEQVLGLLEEIGLVEKTEDGKYATTDSHRLGMLLTKAKNQLGNFGDPATNFVKEVRGLSAPFQQLAFKLRVNEDQLRLLSKELEGASGRLPQLNLESQKVVPARQEAFLTVAGHVHKVRRTAEKVYREGDPPLSAIDPQTISVHIQEVANDTEYKSFSVEYRVQLLTNLADAVEEKRKFLENLVQQLKNKAQTVYCKNIDQTVFPTTPLERILDQAVQDLQEQDVALIPELRTTEIQANLKTYMMAGELDKAFRRLSLYLDWLSEQSSESYINRFARTYLHWQEVIKLHQQLLQTGIKTMEYFQGDPDSSR